MNRERGGHPGDLERVLWLAGELAEGEAARLEEHRASCERCDAHLTALEDSAATLALAQGSGREPGPDCLDEATVAALVDEGLEATERERVLVHLAACPRCRHAAASLTRALRSAPVARALAELDEEGRTAGPARRSGRSHRSSTRSWGTAAAAVAAVAAVVAGILVLRPTDMGVQRTAVHRAAPTGEEAPVLRTPVGAVDGIEEFRWSPVRGADRYRVTLYDAEADVIWEAATDETRIAVPDTLSLGVGALYLWKVGARVDWDRWVESELAEFSISEP